MTLGCVAVVASVLTGMVGCPMANTVTKTVIAKVIPTVLAAALSAELASLGHAQQWPRMERELMLGTFRAFLEKRNAKSAEAGMLYPIMGGENLLSL